MEGICDLFVETRQRVNQTVRVIVESHLNLVAHGRWTATHFVRLPESSDLGGDDGLALQRFGFRERQLVETLQALADAPPLEEDCATRDLSRMRGKNGDDFDLLEPFERRRLRDAALVHPLECTANGAGLRREFRRKLRGAASALALIGLGEIS